MNRHWMLVLICIGITACAVSGPETLLPEEVSGNASNAAENAPPAAEVTVVDVIDDSEDSATNGDPGAVDAPVRNQLVCKRERRTGSNRARKVCRTRAQIEKEEQEAKDTFKDLHRSQREYEVKSRE